MTKIKTTDIPSRAKHLYMKLYCEKKGGKTNDNIRDASQSWLSLSLIKKQNFYDTISTKYAVKKAQQIIQTEPFLRARHHLHGGKQQQINNKRKEVENSRDSEPGDVATDTLVTTVHDDTFMECDNTSNYSFHNDNNVDDKLPETTRLESENNTEEERAEECVLQLSQSVAMPVEPHSNIQERHEESALEQTQNEAPTCGEQSVQKSYMNVIDEDTDTASEDENTIKKRAENTPLCEPVLPILKTGRDLFDLLKERNGVNKPYEALTAREKRYYGNAVCAIKKDYVKKYKEYLESLSARELFDYYMKIF